MHTPGLKGKTVLITGGSRGIGRAIALRCAQDGANVAIAAKTTEAHPALPGTIYSVAEEIRAAGGNALPIKMNIRREEEVLSAVDAVVKEFGGIDILVNNASAISPTGLLDTPLRKYDLLLSINTRGTYAMTQACIPHLRKASNPHVLTLSPPIQTTGHWYGRHLAYCISKFGMSMVTLGVAEEFAADGIAANSLWPRTLIATDAVRVFFESEIAGSRKPEMMSDAAYFIVTSDSRKTTGHCFIDEDVMRLHGIENFDAYAVVPGHPLTPDILI